MKRLFIIVLITITVIAICLFGLFQFVKVKINALPFKQFTEDKLSSVLGARVSISKINFGVRDNVSLSGLRIDASKVEDQGIYLASAKAIKFRYNIATLINKDFKNPNRVTLESPNLLLRNLEFPDNLFEKEELKPLEKPTGFMSQNFQLAIKNGRIDYPLLGHKYKIGLKNVSGIFAPESKDKIDVSLKAKGSGIFRGDISVVGVILPAEKKYDLQFRFRNNGELFLPGFLKLKKIGGVFRVQPDAVTFKRIRFSIADLMFEANGEILNFQTGFPKIRLSVKLLSEKIPQSVKLDLDFEEETISGEIVSFDKQFPFVGDLFREDDSIRVTQVETQNGYLLSADFNILNNNYQFSLEKDPVRINANFSFDNWDTVFYINLEHVMLYEIDLVTFVKIRFSPTEEFKAGKDWTFDGSLETDYLIFDTWPSEDLKGTFKIDQFSIKDIDVNWGERYHLSGGYDAIDKANTIFTLKLNTIDLSKLRHLFLYARPQEFAGFADGELRFTGDLKNPLITGKINLRQGVVGKLEFKTAYIRFQGYYPFLKLSDSKIAQKDKNLYLEGNLNLEAKNIFQDLKVLSEDHIVLWRGVILSESLQDNLVMIGETIKRKLIE